MTERGLRIEARPEQRLLLTPAMQQSLRLLQMTAIELYDYLQQELEENPTLELNETAEEAATEEEKPEPEDEDRLEEWVLHYDDAGSPSAAPREEDANPIEALATQTPTLTEHLLGELHISTSEPALLAAGRVIISHIDDQGYFRGDLAALAEATDISEASYRKALALIQTFDPPGVGARDLRECLLIQIDRRGWTGQWVEEIVRRHLEDIEENRPHKVAEALGIDLSIVLDAAEQIASLEPIPGKSFLSGEVRYIVPDVFVEKIEGEYVITLNEEILPRLRVSPHYLRMLQKVKAEKPEVFEYLKERLAASTNLMKAIDQRQRTLYRVTEAIVRRQRDFFEFGIKHFKPLVLREIAEEIGVHEATVSRATRGKYAQTPRGLYELKFFFSSGIARDDGEEISSRAIKAMIKELVANEDPKRPLSDQRIAERLALHGFHPARRTVSKYREQLGILPARKRKRFG